MSNNDPKSTSRPGDPPDPSRDASRSDESTRPLGVPKRIPLFARDRERLEKVVDVARGVKGVAVALLETQDEIRRAAESQPVAGRIDAVIDAGTAGLDRLTKSLAPIGDAIRSWPSNARTSSTARWVVRRRWQQAGAEDRVEVAAEASTEQGAHDAFDELLRLDALDVERGEAFAPHTLELCERRPGGWQTRRQRPTGPRGE